MAHRIQSILKTSTNLNLIGIRSFSSSSRFDDVQTSKLHLAVNREYPKAEPLPLPNGLNVDPNEATRFSPLRNRDITSSEISVHTSEIDVTLEQQNYTKVNETILTDPRLDSYDRQTPVNLASTMQTLVPEPFSPPRDDPLHSSYLSFPGGSWGQQTKYLSHELNSAHYTDLRQELRSDWSSYKGINNLLANKAGTNLFCLLNHSFIATNYSQKRYITLSAINLNEIQNKDEKNPTKETGRTKLKKAFKEYGATVVVFHVGISLISLGLFYTLVSSGLDVTGGVTALLEKLNLADKAPKFTENASTFLIAYAVHKVFAPMRISITLFSTPLIVRYLRNKKILKP